MIKNGSELYTNLRELHQKSVALQINWDYQTNVWAVQAAKPDDDPNESFKQVAEGQTLEGTIAEVMEQL